MEMCGLHNKAFVLVRPCPAWKRRASTCGRALCCPVGSPAEDRLTAVRVRARVRVSLQLTVSQSVCLGVEPHLGLMTKYLFIYFLWKLRSCQFWGALSDERSGLSFVSQSLEVGRLSVYINKIFLNIYNLLERWYTIFTRPLSVQAHYSRLCPISSSFCCPLSPGGHAFIVWLTILCTPRERGSARFSLDGTHRTIRPWPAWIFILNRV
jgi:hypothetical protein